MFGFAFGTACLVGLFFMVRGGRHGCRAGGGGWRRGRRGLVSGILSRVFRRLDTTVGQEKVVKGAVDDVVAQLQRLRDEARATKDGMAEALRADAFDAGAFDALLSAQQDRIAEVRRSIVQGMAQIHEVLTQEQRRELADMLAARFHRPFGPYRTAG